MQQGDIGAPIRFSLVNGSDPFDLPLGSVVELWIDQPSHAIVRRVFEIIDGAAGLVYYATQAGDLREWGTYRFQARALLPTGERVAFEPVTARVLANIFPAAVTITPDTAALELLAPAVSVA